MEILPMIKEGITLITSDKQNRIGVYYPSTLSYCMRKNYYSYLEPQKFDLQMHKVFAVGSAFHTIIQKALTFYTMKYPELKIYHEPEDIKRTYQGNGYELHGRPDTILTTADGTMHILEFKSIKSIGAWLATAQESHISQLNYYLHFYPEATGNIIYINKQDGAGIEEYREFAGFKYQEALFNILVDRAERLHRHLTQTDKYGIPPAEAYEKEGEQGWQCRYCSYKDKCMAQIKGEVSK